MGSDKMVPLDQRSFITDMTFWRPRVHKGHLGEVEDTSTITSPCRQSCTKQHLDIRNRLQRRKILTEHQAGLGITMLSVDVLSRAPVNYFSCYHFLKQKSDKFKEETQNDPGFKQLERGGLKGWC